MPRHPSYKGIAARDPETGQLGVGVQSHWFSVGSSVLWAEPGIGAVVTQSFIDPSYGPLGLQLMRAGKDASQALHALIAAEALVPDGHEMIFWHAATLAAAGHVHEALPLFGKAFAMWPQWRELVTRLPASGLLPDDPQLLKKILSVE